MVKQVFSNIRSMTKAFRLMADDVGEPQIEIEALKVIVEKFDELNLDKSYMFTIPNQTPILFRKTLRPTAVKFAAGFSKLHCTYPHDQFHFK